MRTLRLASMFLTLSLLLAGCAHTAPPSTAADHHSEAGAAKHGTEALLLSCMDYRLMDDIEHYMSGRGMTNQYDHVILAGAALGATTDKHVDWNTTFWEHLDVAIQLHSIHKVIVMDHRDCGAYKAFLGEDFGKDHGRETEIHTETLRALAKQIHEKHPDLAVELLLMGLDGKVEPVSEAR